MGKERTNSTESSSDLYVQAGDSYATCHTAIVITEKSNVRNELGAITQGAHGRWTQHSVCAE